jgi:hypothetical protein
MIKNGRLANWVKSALLAHVCFSFVRKDLKGPEVQKPVSARTYCVEVLPFIVRIAEKAQ